LVVSEQESGRLVRNGLLFAGKSFSIPMSVFDSLDALHAQVRQAWTEWAMPSLEHRLRRRNADASSKTLPRGARISDGVLDQAAALHEEGRFAEAAQFLQEQGAEVVENDSWAANAIGLSYSQSGLEEQAWQFFETAERAALRRAAHATHNLAVSLKKAKRYAEALSAAERSRRYAPERWPIYLVLAAIYECRSQSGDREAAIAALREMTVACSDYDRDQVSRYLSHDLDYIDLKNDGRLEQVLIDIPLAKGKGK
jgi:tetratricopeptide (TPR) repeat protein